MGTCEPLLSSSRRQFLRDSYLGLGSLALLDVLSSDAARAGTEGRGGATAGNPLRVRPQQIPAKAKRCIFLFMEGGVSQMDTFEYKPALWKYAGQPIPPPRNTVGEIATFAAAPNRVIRSVLAVRPARRIGPMDVGAAAASRHVRRRPGLSPRRQGG